MRRWRCCSVVETIGIKLVVRILPTKRNNLRERGMYRVVIVLFLTFAASGSAWATTFFINNEAGFNTDVSSLTLGLAGTEDWESSSLAAGSLSFISDQIQPGVPHPPFFATGTNAATGVDGAVEHERKPRKSIASLRQLLGDRQSRLYRNAERSAL